MFVHVEEARYVKGYRVRLRFNDGASGEVDLESALEGPLFGAFKDPASFKSFTLAYHTICWPNGVDFAPESFGSVSRLPYERQYRV